MTRAFFSKVKRDFIDRSLILQYKRSPNFDNNGNLQPVSEEAHPDGYILNYYDGELVVTKPSLYTQEELLELINYHPIFTGICPQCKHEFDKNNPPLIHWDCPNCGWIDDSV